MASLQSLQLSVALAIIGNYTGAGDIAAPDAETNLRDTVNFLTGSGINGADFMYVEDINIPASGSQALNLQALVGPLGEAINFARVKAIIILPDPTNVSDIVLAGGATNPFLGPLGGTTPSLTAPPNAQISLVNPTAAGWAVASGNANLKLSNDGGSAAVTGKLIIVGAGE